MMCLKTVVSKTAEDEQLLYQQNLMVHRDADFIFKHLKSLNNLCS